MASPPLSESKAETAESFMGRIVDGLNSSFITVGVAIGSSLGLFTTMASLGEPRTSQEIADAAGLKERYVREWLGVMVTGRIVEMDFDKNTYWLPKHRVDVLTESKGFEGSALGATTLPALCTVYDDLIECFKKDGPRGIPYAKYPAYFDYMDKLAVDKYGKLPPFIRNTKEVYTLLESGISVVDIGCGHGTAICTLAQEFPKSQFHGVDFVEDCLQVARTEAEKRGLTNVTFHAHDAAKLPADWSNKFDYVLALDTIHDQAYPDVVLREIYRILKPAGYFTIIDVLASSSIRDNMDQPIMPMIYATSLLHCMPVSLYFENGMGLGAAWGKEKAQEMVEEAGFRCVFLKPLPDDEENFHCFSEKPDST